MVNISTPKNSVVTKLDEKLSSDVKSLKQYKPSQFCIKNILSYSQSLKIKPSEYIEQIVTVNN